MNKKNIFYVFLLCINTITLMYLNIKFISVDDCIFKISKTSNKQEILYFENNDTNICYPNDGIHLIIYELYEFGDIINITIKDTGWGGGGVNFLISIDEYNIKTCEKIF